MGVPARPGQRSRSRLTGLRAWWVQRASAVCMLVLLVFLLASIAVHPLVSYAQWRAWVAHPGITAAFILFFGLAQSLVGRTSRCPARLRQTGRRAQHVACAGGRRLARSRPLADGDTASPIGLIGKNSAKEAP